MEKQSSNTEKSFSVSRVRRSHRAARMAYNQLSRWYDLIASSEQKFTRLAIDMLAVKPGETALDLGCGTGSALVDLAKATNHKSTIVGADISTGMLLRAKRRLNYTSQQDAFSLVCADAAGLPFQLERFDAIILSFTLELFDTLEIPIILNECSRLLKSGGRLAIVSLAKTISPGWMERSYEWFHFHYEKWADCRPIPAPEFVAEAGFSISDHRRFLMWGLPVDILLAYHPK